MTQDPAVILDRTLETPKGTVRMKIDIRTMMDLLENYNDKLIGARNLPFDLENLSSSDEMVMYASRVMTWERDANKVLRAAIQHYNMLLKNAKRDAAILVATVETPELGFDPEPYPREGQRASWDFSLPVPEINIAHPIERRLKQIIDAIQSDVNGQVEFLNAMQTVWIEAERRIAEIDPDGFQQGRISEPVSSEAVSDSVEQKATRKRSGVAGV